MQFDPSTEYLTILHPSRGIGDDFKMLGTLFDTCLSMHPCLESVLAKVRPKIRALLRLRNLYSVRTMLEQYKSHIWGITEYSNGALILAAPSQLQRLDKMQRWYLHELGITDEEAFVTYNFAPPSLRRHIGMLGFLHKIVLGECHPALRQALPFAPPGLIARFHTNALDPQRGEVISHDRLYMRSIYAFILVYDSLPQTLADSPTIASFQARLTHLAKQKASTSEEMWKHCFRH